jgi:hypothetical protein
MLFEWNVPPECPSEQVVTAQVTAIVGEELARTPLLVRGLVTETDEHRYRLDLRLGPRAEVARTIESEHCEKLAEAAAVIVALNLQSSTHVESGPTTAELGRAQEGPPPSFHPGPTPTRRSADDLWHAETHVPSRMDRRIHAGLGADLSLDVGTLPMLGWGGGVHGFVHYGRARGEVAAMLWPRNRADASIPSGAGAYVSLRTVALAGCLMLLAHVDVSTCLRLEGGHLRATGFGISNPSTANGLWLGSFVGLAARPFGWNGIAPRLNLEVGTPLYYGDVEIERRGVVYTPSRALFRIVISVETKLF